MGFFKRLIDLLALGSDRPLRRLLAYYLALAAVLLAVFHFLPTAGTLIKGDHARQLVLICYVPMVQIIDRAKATMSKWPVMESVIVGVNQHAAV